MLMLQLALHATLLLDDVIKLVDGYQGSDSEHGDSQEDDSMDLPTTPSEDIV